MILPNKATLYFLEEDLSIYLFSSNPQAENNLKKPINSFGYIFYKKLKKRKILSKKIIYFYIPKIFSVISSILFTMDFRNYVIK